jgi:hypothetical protein
VGGLDSPPIRLYSSRGNANGVTDRSRGTGSMKDHVEWETKIDRENWEGRGRGQTVGREIDSTPNPSDLRPTLEGGYAPFEPRTDARGHGTREPGAMVVTVYAALIHRTYARRWRAGTPRLNHGLTPVVMEFERDFGARIHELISKIHDSCNTPTSKSLWWQPSLSRTQQNSAKIGSSRRAESDRGRARTVRWLGRSRIQKTMLPSWKTRKNRHN